jgi:hypothetical protein
LQDAVFDTFTPAASVSVPVALPAAGAKENFSGPAVFYIWKQVGTGAQEVRDDSAPGNNFNRRRGRCASLSSQRQASPPLSWLRRPLVQRPNILTAQWLGSR